MDRKMSARLYSLSSRLCDNRGIECVNSLYRAISCLGDSVRLAKAIGCSKSAPSMWIKRGRVPAGWCIAIEKATVGAVRCEELRPDIDWGYLRNNPIQSVKGSSTTEKEAP